MEFGVKCVQMLRRNRADVYHQVAECCSGFLSEINVRTASGKSHPWETMGLDIPEGGFYLYILLIQRRSRRRREICPKDFESLNHNEAELNITRDGTRTVDSRRSSVREPKKFISNSPLLSSFSGNFTVRSTSFLIGVRRELDVSRKGRFQPAGLGPLSWPCAIMLGSILFCTTDSKVSAPLESFPATMSERL